MKLYLEKQAVSQIPFVVCWLLIEVMTTHSILNILHIGPQTVLSTHVEVAGIIMTNLI